eukprot:COSAG01_NODE_2232_length_8117_cov_4.366426_6_plen_241_part_00
MSEASVDRSPAPNAQTESHENGRCVWGGRKGGGHVMYLAYEPALRNAPADQIERRLCIRAPRSVPPPLESESPPPMLLPLPWPWPVPAALPPPAPSESMATAWRCGASSDCTQLRITFSLRASSSACCSSETPPAARANHSMRTNTTARTAARQRPSTCADDEDDDDEDEDEDDDADEDEDEDDDDEQAATHRVAIARHTPHRASEEAPQRQAAGPTVHTMLLVAMTGADYQVLTGADRC